MQMVCSANFRRSSHTNDTLKVKQSPGDILAIQMAPILLKLQLMSRPHVETISKLQSQLHPM